MPMTPGPIAFRCRGNPSRCEPCAHRRGRERAEVIRLRDELGTLPSAAGVGPSAKASHGCKTNQYVGSELIGARAVVV